MADHPSPPAVLVPERSSAQQAAFEASTAPASMRSGAARRWAVWSANSSGVAGWYLRTWLLAPASARSVLLGAALPVLSAALLLIAPGVVFSRNMTWDLLFNLSGAWHIHNGQVPHVDFHDPLGPLTFYLTQLGFRIIGTTPFGFLVAEFIVLAGLFAAAAAAAIPRLPTIPAVIFVVHAALLAVLPANVGDPPNAYSFAMFYNRWGWSALTTLCVVLFIQPRQRSRGWADALLGVSLLAFMFYVKITFAMAGLIAVGCAALLTEHVRLAWRRWTVMLVILLADVASPHNRAYLSDVWQAAQSGYVRDSLMPQVLSLFANRTEYGLYGSGVLVLFLLWRYRRVPVQAVLTSLVVLGLGMFVLSQNAQSHGIPVGIVIIFLVYDAIRRQRARVRTIRTRDLVVVLLVVLTGPLLSVISELTTFVGYARAASQAEKVLRLRDTNLRGLAVPRDKDDMTGALAHTGFTVLGEMQSPPLTAARYVQTLVEAAELFDGNRRGRVRILTLDAVNPLPFMLGYPPPRGGNLWIGVEAPRLAAEVMFGDVDVVLVPKYPTSAPATVEVLTTYGEYLTSRFPVREEIDSWTILSRTR